jgi:hypothetical protein
MLEAIRAIIERSSISKEALLISREFVPKLRFGPQWMKPPSLPYLMLPGDGGAAEYEKPTSWHLD